MWNRCVRRLLQLAYTTHRSFLPGILGKSSARDQIYSRFLKLLWKMERSRNIRVKFIAEMFKDNPRSIIGGNLQTIAKRLTIQVLTVQTEGRQMLHTAYMSECSEQDVTALSLINEVRECLRGDVVVGGFDKEEMECILNDVCVN